MTELVLKMKKKGKSNGYAKKKNEKKKLGALEEIGRVSFSFVRECRNKCDIFLTDRQGK